MIRKKPIELLKDSSYAKGMNDVDDPTALGDGYCAELVNAYPGFPVEMRKGIEWTILYDDGVSTVSGVNRFSRVMRTFFWKNTLFAWVHGGSEVYLVYIKEEYGQKNIRPVKFINPTNSSATADYLWVCVLSGIVLDYSFEPVGDVLYIRLKYNGSNNPWTRPDANVQNQFLNRYVDCNMLAVEMGSGEVPAARFVPSAKIEYYTAPNSSSILPYFDLDSSHDAFWMRNQQKINGDWIDSANYGVIGAYGFSLTLVRRLDIPAGEADTPRKIFSPGLIESPQGRLTPLALKRGGLAFRYKNGGMEYNKILFQWNTGGVNNHAQDYNFFGFTHVRIYRTRNFAVEWNDSDLASTRRDIIDGATRYFMVDVPIRYNSDGNSSGLRSYVWEHGSADDSLDDLIAQIEASDGELIGEANTLQSAPYNFPPADGEHMKYHKSRMFLLGEKGQVYFSEVPGGDGGTDLEMAQLTPEKYALWYKLYDRYDLRAGDGVKTTGIASFDDDLYFFKQNKIWCLAGGMPPAMPRIISEDVGCAFGGTLVSVRVDNESKLFFLSEASPMLISAGGYVREFAAFKCKALWPAADEWATAVFWGNKIWVFCGGESYGYSVDEEYAGAFEMSPAKIHVDEYNQRITSADVLPDGHLVFWGVVEIKSFPSDVNAPSARLVIGEWRDEYADILNNQGYAESSGHYKTGAIETAVRSRRHIPGPQDRNMAELLKATLYCVFDEGANPFIVKMRSNRFFAERDYNGGDKEYINNQAPDGKRYMRTNIALIPESDFMGERFEYEIIKKAEAGFKLYGAEMEVILRPNLNSDDLVGGEDNKEIWMEAP